MTRDTHNPEIVGASNLTELHGYWPTFQDASLESILIERVGLTLTTRFSSCDVAYDGHVLR